MKAKKIISLILSLSVVMSVMTFTAVTSNAAAIPAPQETTLFSDDFESATVRNWTWPKVQPNELSNLILNAGMGSGATTADNYTTADATKALSLAENTGLGTGKALKLTAQSQAQRVFATKGTGFTAENVAGKKLVFTVKFNVPNLVTYADGAGIYLMPEATSYEFDTTNQKVHLTGTKRQNANDMAATDGKAGELVYLGKRPGPTRDMWSCKWDVYNKGNELWTFGEKVADLTPGTNYTYTVTMTPDSQTGKYIVETDLNGTKLTLPGTAATSTIPATADMAGFKAVSIGRLSSPYNFSLSQITTGVTFTDWLASDTGAKKWGIMTAEGLYNNDRVVAYFDDMSMKAVDIQDVVFSDDFESYTADPRPGRYNWAWGRPSDLYDYDDFRYTYGTVIDYTTDTTLGKLFDSVADYAKVAVIDPSTGVGSGKALKLTDQMGANGYSLAKKSHLDTADIAGKQLEFRADFKAPISGIAGVGFGVWVQADNGSEIYELSQRANLSRGTAAAGSVEAKFYKGEFMYVGSRKLVEAYGGASADMGYGAYGSRATYLYVFGEEVARLNPDAKYDIKVTLTPSGEGYTAAVTLNGVTKVLQGTNVPAQAEMATFKRLYATPIISSAWVPFNQGGALQQVFDQINQGKTAYLPEDMFDENGVYKMGRTLGILDNLSLLAKGTATAVTATPAGNLASVDYGATAWSNSFLSGNAAVDGTTATVSVRSENATNVTPVIIAAAYSGDKLLGVKMNTTTTVAPFTTEEVTLSGLPEGYTSVKVFLLNNLTNLIPVTTTFAQ